MKRLSNYRPAISILLFVLILAACKVSKDVALPVSDLPVAYRGEAPVVDTLSISAMPWNTFFADTELKSLIADALAHNNDLQVAVKNLEAAGLVLKQAKLGNLPSVGLQINAVTNRPSDNSLNGLTLNQFLNSKHIEDYTAAVSLSWEADIWGKIRSRKAVALADYLGTEEARKGVQTQLISDVSKGYYNLLMLDAQLAIAQKNVKLNDSTLNIIRLQYQAGQVTSLAVQQADAQLLSASALLPQFEQQIGLQENAISILSGRAPNITVRQQLLEVVLVKDQLNAGLPSALLQRRPDVKQSELALVRANASVGYAKANLYPSLTITAQGGLNAFKASNWFNIPASLFGGATAGILQPLFQQKKLRTDFEVAKINREQTVIRFRQSVLTAVGEVSDALVKIDKLKEQQTLVNKRTLTLQLATHNSQLLFKNGLATYLEVITAQGNVLQSELEQASIKKARLDATVDLYRAVGGGWN